MLSFAVTIAAGGCAQQSVLRYQVAAGPAQGIDNVIYGQVGAPAYGMAAPAAYAPRPAYAAAAPPAYSQPAYSQPAYSQPAYSQPAYNTVAAPAYGMAAPAYGGVAMVGGSYPGGMMVASSAAYVPQAAYPPQALQFTYTLDSGDRLRVVVFGQEGLTNSYVLDASGQIAMPLIGTVPARGLTTDQLRDRIAGMLQQGFVREPHVAVEVEAYRPFFILGEVAQPGQYPYTPNMTVETAVAIAGGFGPRALHNPVVVSRNYNGQQLRFQTPLTAQIQPGDTVQVKERWF
jgi:polysaccharide export outer membrane protein